MSHADVLIIGAGAAGGVAGRRLAEAGLNVVALEQGEWQDRADYRGSEWDWELAASGPWSSRLDVRRGPTDYPVDLSDSDMAILNFNAVGGSTILYNGIWIRLLESNFCSHSRYGIGDDWPLSYAELQPFYERTDREVGVSGLGGNPAYPPGAEPPLPPIPFSPGALTVARALAERGWHWWPDTNAILSTPYDGRNPCVRRGTCMQGCNEGAKGSFDLTHWRRFTALGGRLQTGARVRRIVLDRQGLACGAEWIDASGTVQFQSADVVLVAANGIGTPRLLLNSASERCPDGLANSSGLVGRRLMLHPLSVLYGYFEDSVQGWQGQNGSTVQCLEFGQDDPSRGHRAGCKWALHPTGSGPVGEAMRTIVTGAAPDKFHARFAERFGHGLMFSIMCEDLPDEDNRVVLSPDLTDSAGIPAAKLIYRTSDNARAILDYNVERASEVFRAAGARELQAFHPAGGNAHLMGTARMGDDPQRSVVDRWCMSHDVANLGVIDGSVFVTSGAVNPTSTIAALALRAAERLIEHREALPKPDRSGHTTVDLGKVALAAPPAVPAPLDAEERTRLFVLADMLLPAVDDIPAGGEVLAAGMFERAMSVRPDLAGPLRNALHHRTETVGGLLAVDPELWQAAITAITGAYYLDPRVRARIGYEGQVPNPQTPDRYPAYFEEGLLDHMLDPAWRERWDARQAPEPALQG